MTPRPLMKLTNQGMAAVDAAFLAGTPAHLPDTPSFATPIQTVEGAVFTPPSFELPEGPLGPQHDPVIALALHDQLDIRRGLATDPRMWAWIAARHAPALLRRRWSTGGRPPKRGRLVGRLVDNGLSRLWWAAELTRDRDMTPSAHSYAVSALLSSQYRTDRLLSMPLLRHPPVMLGVLDVIGEDLRWQVLNEVCRRVGLLATTYAIDTMGREEVRSFLGRIHRDVLAGRNFSSEMEPAD